MTERPILTDEQLRVWLAALIHDENSPETQFVLTELLALRAERAKLEAQWQSDIKAYGDLEDENAKLEASLKDAAIVARTMPIQTDSRGGYSDGFKDARNYIADRLDDIIRAALPIAQPAESGATVIEMPRDPMMKIVDGKPIRLVREEDIESNNARLIEEYARAKSAESGATEPECSYPTCDPDRCVCMATAGAKP